MTVRVPANKVALLRLWSFRLEESDIVASGKWSLKVQDVHFRPFLRALSTRE